MAKGIAWLKLATLATLTLSACSQSNTDQSSAPSTPIVVSYPISNSKFKNCRFQNLNPTYSVNAQITPNPIDCDEGVATSVQLLSTTALPTGLTFSTATLSLVGTPSEKVSNAPYQFYVENEAGYVILTLNLTVN
jgi:hypothetical protein